MPAYREPVERVRRGEARELVVAPVDASTRHSALVLFQLIGLPAFVAYGANELIGGYAAWPALIVTIFATYFWWRGSKMRGRAVLRLYGDKVVVSMHDGAFRTRTLETTLDELHDVVLDTKTIRRVSDGSTLVPQTALISTTVGGAIDRSRILLVTARTGEDAGDDETTPLFHEDVPHMEATEWISKIRVFLRRAGWTPIEERPE